MKEKFEIIRKNALANPNLYGGRYTQKNRKDAYIEFLEDILRASDALRKKRPVELFLVWNPDGNSYGSYYNDSLREPILEHQLNIRIVGTLEEVIDEAEEYYHEHFECEEDYDEDFEIETVEELDEFWNANGYAMTSFIVEV